MADSEIQFNQLNAPTDQHLWESLIHGDESAYSFIYEHFIDDLYGYGKNICTHRTLVEDAIQDVFTDLWKYKSNLASVRSIKAYLLISLRRKILRLLQKEKLFIVHNDKLPEDNFHWENSIQDILIQEQDLKIKIKRIEKAMGQLTRRQKEIIYLRYFQDLSHQEIAEMMGLNQRSTYNLVSKAINLLKDKLIILIILVIS